MADWKQRFSARGRSPAIPNEDIPRAVHLDFLKRSSAARVAVPCNRDGGSGAGSTKEREAAIMPTRWLIRMIAEEGLLLPRADRNGDDTKMAVATMGPPFQPRQCQVSVVFSATPPPKHATVTFVNK